MYVEDLCITEVALQIREEGIPQVMLGQLIITLHIQNNIIANVYRSYYVPGTILCVLHVFIFLQMYISNPKHALELPNFHIDWVFFIFLSFFLETQTESLLFLIKATRAVFPRT